jgi:hypothetical protein
MVGVIPFGGLNLVKIGALPKRARGVGWQGFCLIGILQKMKVNTFIFLVVYIIEQEKHFPILLYILNNSKLFKKNESKYFHFFGSIYNRTGKTFSYSIIYLE